MLWSNWKRSGIQSIVTLTILALQRYMMVTRSDSDQEIWPDNELHSRDKQFPLSTSASTFSTLIFIWIYSALVSFPPLTGFGKFGLNSLGVRWVVQIWNIRAFPNIPSANSEAINRFNSILSLSFSPSCLARDKDDHDPPCNPIECDSYEAGSGSGSAFINSLFSCGVVWAGGDSDSPSLFIFYIIFIYLFGFVFPLLIISTSYLKIIKTIRKDLSICSLKP